MKEWKKYSKDGFGKTKKMAGRNGLSLIKIVLAELLAGAVGIVVLIMVLFPADENPILPDGEMTACLQAGQLSITWPAPLNADACRLYLYDDKTNEYVFYGEYENNSATLSEIEENTELKLRLQAVKFTKNFGQACEKKSNKREWILFPIELQSPLLQKETNAAKKSLTISWNMESENYFGIYFLNEKNNWIFLQNVNGTMAEIRFGEELALPEREHPAVFAVRAMRREEGCVYYSELSSILKVDRKELLGTEPALIWEKAENGTYSLSWQETRGDTYEIQQWSEETGIWIPKGVFSWDSPLYYEIGKLPSGAQVKYRVLAHEKDVSTGEIIQKTTSSEVTFRAEISPLYCSIWPITALDLWPDAQSEEPIGSVEAGKALCVLDEENDRFKVFSNGKYGYIDSRFCMIDLSEYLGDLCHYDITNSYESVFRVHGYEIPNITGNVIPGFEQVYLGENRFLVPYLYPCAQKLMQAAEMAEKDGYCLRIYEAFRPNEATKYLYSTMSALLDMPVIEVEEGEIENISGKEEDSLINGSVVIDASNFALRDENMADPLVEPLLTYRTVMTDNRYRLSAFLAQSVSAHNRGIALDLTLEKRDTGEELEMQSDIHDLSWYSVLEQNNENARLLSRYMKGVGFNDLSSEWWHFQDDEIREEIGLDAYLISGVSPVGWKKDDSGWRYRQEDGNYLYNGSVSVEGKTYTFDKEGYCMNFEN